MKTASKEKTYLQYSILFRLVGILLLIAIITIVIASIFTSEDETGYEFFVEFKLLFTLFPLVAFLMLTTFISFVIGNVFESNYYQVKNSVRNKLFKQDIDISGIRDKVFSKTGAVFGFIALGLILVTPLLNPVFCMVVESKNNTCNLVSSSSLMLVILTVVITVFAIASLALMILGGLFNRNNSKRFVSINTKDEMITQKKITAKLLRTLAFLFGFLSISSFPVIFLFQNHICTIINSTINFCSSSYFSGLYFIVIFTAISGIISVVLFVTGLIVGMYSKRN